MYIIRSDDKCLTHTSKLPYSKIELPIIAKRRDMRIRVVWQT